jgi:integrase
MSRAMHDPRPPPHAASLLLATGVHPKVVQERLGHSMVSITIDTYSHVLGTLQREAADKVEEMLK